jgi:hypothetical protein
MECPDAEGAGGASDADATAVAVVSGGTVAGLAFEPQAAAPEPRRRKRPSDEYARRGCMRGGLPRIAPFA